MMYRIMLTPLAGGKSDWYRNAKGRIESYRTDLDAWIAASERRLDVQFKVSVLFVRRGK